MSLKDIGLPSPFEELKELEAKLTQATELIEEMREALECNESFHRLGGIDDCEPCKALAAYKKWKENK